MRPAEILIRCGFVESSLGTFSMAKDAKLGRLLSDCADAQADFSLRWAHISEGTFIDSFYTCNTII